MGFWELNLQFLAMLAAHRNAFFDFFFAAVTWLGSEYVVVAVLAVCFLLINKKTAYKLGCSFLMSSTAVQLVKVIFRIPRPWILIREHPIDAPYAPLDKFGSLDKATGYSFPSGHTQSAVSLYGFLALRTNKAVWRILLFALAALVMFSRLYLGVHTPLDVVTAAAVSILFLVLTEVFFDRLYDTKWHFVLPLAVGIASAVTAIVTLDVFDAGLFGAEEKMCYDALKVAALGVSLPLCYLVERRFISFDPKEGSVLRKALRLVIALGGTVGVKEIVKVFGKLIYGDLTLGTVFLSYFVMMPFAMLAVPAAERLIVKKIAGRREKKNAGEA
ncbi:MAG: phosphatase PAP2 family protein [Clostridia bacterium]|nr:phosphatase PAP2 family protein [Clostridia bacterium]